MLCSPMLAQVSENGTSAIWIIVLIVLIVVFLIIFGLLFQFVGLYIRALVSGARVSLLELLGMRLRKVNGLVIVNSRIQAIRGGSRSPKPTWRATCSPAATSSGSSTP